MAEFSASERNVAGYLLAEVLERQPAEVRDMLHAPSVLEETLAAWGPSPSQCLRGTPLP